LKKWLDILMGAWGKERSWRFKAVAMLLGATVFVVIVLALLFLAAWLLEKRVLSVWARPLELGVSILSLAIGFFFFAWSMYMQVRIGKGTPVPIAPPQRLIVTGPYALCRNPLQLGVILYYLSLGTYFGSLKIGLAMFFLGLVLGSSYHKFVEEKELGLRFGDEYEEYRRRTPFLIPKLWT
jgi:protein-S-isoprenylcysteine O-methyltransferase Ste14